MSWKRRSKEAKVDASEVIGAVEELARDLTDARKRIGELTVELDGAVGGEKAMARRVAELESDRDTWRADCEAHGRRVGELEAQAAGQLSWTDRYYETPNESSGWLVATNRYNAQFVRIEAAEEWQSLAEQRGTDLTVARKRIGELEAERDRLLECGTMRDQSRIRELEVHIGERTFERDQARERIVALEAAGATAVTFGSFREVGEITGPSTHVWRVREIPSNDHTEYVAAEAARLWKAEATRLEAVGAKAVQWEELPYGDTFDGPHCQRWCSRMVGDTRAARFDFLEAWQQFAQSESARADKAERERDEAKREVTRLNATMATANATLGTIDQLRRDSEREVADLTERLKAVDSVRIEAEALVISHEGRIERLTAELGMCAAGSWVAANAHKPGYYLSWSMGSAFTRYWDGARWHDGGVGLVLAEVRDPDQCKAALRTPLAEESRAGYYAAHGHGPTPAADCDRGLSQPICSVSPTCEGCGHRRPPADRGETAQAEDPPALDPLPVGPAFCLGLCDRDVQTAITNDRKRIAALEERCNLHCVTASKLPATLAPGRKASR
jgi:hypothetical protein